MKNIAFPAAALLILLFCGCAELGQMGTTVGQGAGVLSAQDKDALDQLIGQSAKAIRPMTDQEEYFLGRAVAAAILSRYKLYEDPQWNRYLNEVG
ncbi:MAG TPA: peptidase M48, partial [Thermodesulfobacteriota bacterium]|nr:peptidase M48 [Thermodesulfobacteriota bacterium]